MELKIPVTVEYTNVVVEICKEHPTCEGCPFQKKHKGCYFRGKTPREWKFPKEFEDVKATNIEDTNEYQIGYKTGYDIAQCNAQATKEEWGKAEYDRGFEDGKNEAIYNTELIPELKKTEYTKGYNSAIRDCKSNMLDKIKQAREEMESRLYNGIPQTTGFTWQNLGINMCLEILDKLIESEG